MDALENKISKKSPDDVSNTSLNFSLTMFTGVSFDGFRKHFFEENDMDSFKA